MVPRKIIIHRGQCHLDELIAVAFALAIGIPVNGRRMSLMPTPLFRRDPTDAELDDPSTLVLDVGGRHQPHLNNFDHHQRERDAAPECAASLLLAHIAPEFLVDLKRFTRWFDALVQIDVRGPFAWAKANNLPEFPFALGGALEAPIKEIFEAFDGDRPVPEELVGLLWRVGCSHVDFVNKRKAAYDDVRTSAQYARVGEIEGIVYLSKDTSAMQLWRDELAEQGRVLGFSIMLDDRGEGLTLYRFNDDSRLDFARLAGNPAVSFAHAGGFIAKTRKMMRVDEALELVQGAVNT